MDYVCANQKGETDWILTLRRRDWSIYVTLPTGFFWVEKMQVGQPQNFQESLSFRQILSQKKEKWIAKEEPYITCKEPDITNAASQWVSW